MPIYKRKNKKISTKFINSFIIGVKVFLLITVNDFKA